MIGGGEQRTGSPDSLKVLRGVSFHVAAGECLAVVGESGSGKTTLARCILRLVEPEEGQVFYRDQDVLGMDPDELRAFRRQAQIVFQDTSGSLNPRQRAGSMIEEVLRVHDPTLPREARYRKVLELLKLVGLGANHLNRFPHEFSGGQRQRLGIARALAVEPELLILDEPVTALDLSVQAQVLSLLMDLQSRLNLTMILVAHDLAVVRQVSHRVMVMYGGIVVETAPTPVLFDSPRHPYTRGLMAAAEPPDGDGTTRGDARTGKVSLARSGAWGSVPSGNWEPLSHGGISGGLPDSGCIYRPRCPHPEKDRSCEVECPGLSPVGDIGMVACWKENGS